MKKIKAVFSYVLARPWLFFLIISPLANLFIESLGRHSFLAGLSHMVLSPLIFAYNSLIIFMTLSVAMLFRRKYFFSMIILFSWMTLGIVNGVLLSYRDNPLTAIDFFIVKACGDFFAEYFGWWQILLVIFAVFFIVSLFVFVWRKAPRPKIKKLSAISLIFASVITVGMATVLGLETEMLSNKFDNLGSAYEDYGFAYCFSCGLLDTGVDEPKEYSKEAIEAILSELPADTANTSATKPDIVIVQLESFFDPTFIRGIELSDYPIPNFRALSEKYASGFLSVQSIGGGTANTEFEVLTGMNLEHFGPAEYPYMTELSDNACYAMPHYLCTLGYASHAFHNYTGAFYDRHIVYANLGFDSFTSMEFMCEIERNPRGWVNDACLVPYITKALDREDNSFVWAATVQTHGDYPNEKVDCKYDISVGGVLAESVNPTEYFVNQLKETDDFIGELISELEKREEPTVVLLYGDHLPPLGISEDALDGITLYQTEYVIWSNFDMDNTDRDIEAYQLGARLFELIGYRGTVINALSSTDDELQMIEYDLLYGKGYSLEGKEIVPADMKMGIDDIVINELQYEDDRLILRGENFTEWSSICIDGKKQDTLYIDSHTLVAENVRLRADDEIWVEQVANSGITLGESNKVKAEES